MSEDTATIYHEEGQRLYRAAKYAEAEKAFRKALEEEEPPSAEIYCDLGDTLSRMGHHAGAADFFRWAAERDPESARAHKGRGDALGELLLYDSALDAYRHSIEVAGRAGSSEDSALGYNAIGDVYYYMRRFKEAAENYSKAAELLDQLAQSYLARSDGRKAAETLADASDMHSNLGYAYMALLRYDDARAEFEAATIKAVKYPYAYHNLASLYWKLGKYRAAMEQWANAYYRYDEEVLIAEACEKHWPGHFRYFGNLLHEVFGDLEKAEKMYMEAIRISPSDPWFMIDLMNLYLEKAEEGGARTDAYWKAKELRERAEKELKRRLRDYGQELTFLTTLGELYLAWKEYDEAEQYLKAARSLDEAGGEGYTRTAKPYASLGVLHMRRKDYAKAVVSFRLALDIERDDLTLRSNLAEAHLRAGEFDAAEREYARVLLVTPDHIESLIGMGEISLAHADAGDMDKYDEAVTLLGNAVKLAALKKGSKRLKNKELAKTLYLKAYARGRLFDASKARDYKPLYSARDDLRLCFKADPELYLAKRALEKVERGLPGSSPQSFLEKFGPYLLLIFSSLVFVIAQASLFVGALQKLTAEHYLFMTFGSLLLVVASLYLPQVGKLKFAVLELEKKGVDQITTLGTLGISKWT